MDNNIILKGTILTIDGHPINITKIDFITLNDGINVYCSNGNLLHFKIKADNFLKIGRAFYDAGIEQFVYLKGNRIVNVENIDKVYYNDSYLEVKTANNAVKMYGLGKNEAKMLAEMYYSVPFVSEFCVEK